MRFFFLDLQMLIALYDFNASLSQTLSFEKNDLFIFHSSNNIKKNWWSVVSNKGKLGYIPSNYVSINRASNFQFISSARCILKRLSRPLFYHLAIFISLGFERRLCSIFESSYRESRQRNSYRRWLIWKTIRTYARIN